MPKFKIIYTFDGDGHSFIEAKTQEEAEEMFFNGDAEYENEETSNFEIHKTIKL